VGKLTKIWAADVEITNLPTINGGTLKAGLGVTTVGDAFLTLVNPSAITFPRIDAANTVTARSAANFKADLSLENVTNESKATMFTNPSFTGTLYMPSGGVIDWDAGDVTLTHSANTLTVGGGDLAMGANNITGTGSLGATGAGKFTKGWFTDIETTNTPTVNGVQLNKDAPNYTIERIVNTYYANPSPGSGLTAYSGAAAATVINQAITALTAGGNVYFKQDTYVLDDSIGDGGRSNINLIFERGAILYCNDSLNAPAIYLNGVSHWKIEGVEINGNRN